MLSRKTWKIEAHKDLNPNTMAAGERICLVMLILFAVRKVLNLNLPAVFDAPYGRLDEELKQVIRAFVKEQTLSAGNTWKCIRVR